MPFVAHPWINPGTIEQRAYQENIAKTALAGNTLCVLPTGLGKCHAYNDYVITESGDLQTIGALVESAMHGAKTKEIEDGYIIAGNSNDLKVLSWTEHGIIPCKVLGFSKRMAKELIKIKTATGIEVNVTPEHPLLTLNENLQWVKASELEVGSPISIPKKLSIVTENRKINFFQIFKNVPGKGAMVRMKDGTSINIKKLHKTLLDPQNAEGVFYKGGPSVNHVLKPIYSVSEDLARFAGLITAEARIASGVRFYNEDPNILDDFRHLSKRLFDIEPESIEGGLLLKSTALHYFLRFALGIIPSHSRDKTISKIILESPDEVVGAYLGGLYDGEGSVRSDGLIEFTTASNDIAYKLPYLLRRFGIVCRVKRKFSRATNSPNPKTRLYYRIHIEGKEDLILFSKYIGFRHSERSRKLEGIISSSRIPNTNTDTFPLKVVLKKMRTAMNLVTSRNKDFQNISDFGLYERGQRNPSRKTLKYLILILEKRYKDINELEKHIERLYRANYILENYRGILAGIKNEDKKDVLSKSKVSEEQLNNWINGKWKPKIRKNFPFMRLLNTLGYNLDTLEEDIKTTLKTFRLTWHKLKKKNLFMLYINPNKLNQLISYILYQWESVKKINEDIKFINKILNSEIQFDKITGIEIIKEPQWVYDLCTESGNFIAGDYGGLISHNTSIAALVAAECLSKNMKGKILFLAPTKPLVSQHRRNFEKMLKLGVELTAITGETKAEERFKLYKNADIIFATPQTVGNDIKAGILDLSDFSLIVFDEAHRCVGQYSYVYIAKQYMNRAKQPLILALTASPGGHRYKINEVRDRLFIKNVEIKTREDADVKPYVQSVENDWITVELPIPMKSVHAYLNSIKNSRLKKLLGWGIINSPHVSKSQLLKLQETLAKKKTGYAFGAMSLIAEIIKVDHALLLLETQCLYSLQKYLEKLSAETTRAAGRLLSDENFKNAIRLTNELVEEGKEHPKLEKLVEIIREELKNKEARIIVFAQYRDTISKICESLSAIKGAAPVEFIGQAKKKGKGLSQKEQIQILNEFQMGFYNILCASQVAEEGLDVVETNAVIFYEPTPSAIRKIQRAGRTARTQQGKVIILITKDTRDEAFHWSAYQKEKQMKKTLYHMQRGSSQKSLGEFRWQK